jgi:hypothetical protein
MPFYDRNMVRLGEALPPTWAEKQYKAAGQDGCPAAGMAVGSIFAWGFGGRRQTMPWRASAGNAAAGGPCFGGPCRSRRATPWRPLGGRAL